MTQTLQNRLKAPEKKMRQQLDVKASGEKMHQHLNQRGPREDCVSSWIEEALGRMRQQLDRGGSGKNMPAARQQLDRQGLGENAPAAGSRRPREECANSWLVEVLGKIKTLTSYWELRMP
ncbi:hypothetical protein MMC22_008421 [Lobaria immixta]|nr:hypothetical protein [Lobaria immixta]